MLNSIIKVISAQRRNSIIQGVRNRRPHSFLLASSQLPSATATATATSRQYATRLFSSSNMSEVPIVSTSISDNESAATFTPSSEKDGKQHTLYEELVRKLYMTNLYNPVKLGLENTVKLHEVLGSPLNNPNMTIIHIAGTNGKGSVAIKTAKTLELAGHRTGLFVSPHISSFRERMSVDGVPISEEEVEILLSRVFDAVEEHNIPATFFEITTILAFLFYGEKKVEAVVLETGLGGRLDSTNIVEDPALAIITSIGLEHTRILGDTVELIALEKGGIIKKDRPVLVGPEAPHDILRQCAQEKGASSYYTCDDVLGPDDDNDDDAFTNNDLAVKDYDEENSRMVTAAFKILEECKNEALRDENKDNAKPSWKNLRPISEEHIRLGTSIRPSCRFEVVDVLVDESGEVLDKSKSDTPALALAPSEEKKWNESKSTVTAVLDVAHNPPAMVHLVSKLQETFPNVPKRFIAGFSSDKDLRLCTSTLIEACEGDMTRIHLIEAAHPRAAKLEMILNAAPELEDGCNLDVEDRSITAQLKHAVKLASKQNEIVVVCGSVFIMADAREALGFNEPKDSDYIAEVAGSGVKNAQENFGDLNTPSEKN